MNTTTNPIKLFIFYCSNSFNIDEFNRGFVNEQGDVHRMISLPCSGKLDLLYFMKAFETGADGLLVITCPMNECRYLEGNLRAPKRAEEVNTILAEIGITEERIMVLHAKDQDMDKLITQAFQFRNSIRSASLKQHIGRDQQRSA